MSSRLRCGLIVVAGSVFALTGGQVLAQSGSQQAQSPAHESRVKPKTFTVFSHANPQEIISSIQKRLLRREGISVESVSLSPSSLVAVGDCTAEGAVYRVWEETESYLKRTRCDDPETVDFTERRDPEARLRFTKELKRVGSDLVNAIPGQAVDFKQKGITLSGDINNGLTESLRCPRRRKEVAAMQFATVRLLPDNESIVTFCPSRKISILASPNEADPTYKRALRKYLDDKNRAAPQGGVNQGTNLYFYCPDSPDYYWPRARFRYLRQKGVIRIRYDGSNYGNYCDKVGRYTLEILAEASKPGRDNFRRVGPSVLHTSGLGEILMFGGYTHHRRRGVDFYGLNTRQQRNTVRIPLAKDLCRGTKVELRLRFISRFRPLRSQRWFPIDGRAVAPRPGRYRQISGPKVICR